MTDDALVNLKGLEKLTALNLEETAVTDAGLEHLAGLTKMRRMVGWRPASSSSSQWAPSNTGVEIHVDGSVTGRVFFSVPRTGTVARGLPSQPQRAA